MSTKNKYPLSEKSLDFLSELSGRKVTIANTLWAIRECEEMTQAEMAKLLGISRQYLCDIEHGRRKISLKMAATFAEKLGYSAAHFITITLQDELNKAGLAFDVSLREQRNAA